MSATPDSTLADPKQLISDLRRELAECRAERDEALAQQTATAEVLQVINSSPGNLSPVFEAMLDKALHLCEAGLGLLHTYDGKRFRALAIGGVSGTAAESLREWVPDPDSALQRIVDGEQVVHIPDVVDTEAYRCGVASRRKLVETTGARTALWVALRKDDTLLGVFVIYRRDVRPFSDRQISLLQNFAAQAVIAMENARLITETREALDQQTATVEILQAINGSPTDLRLIFEAIANNAARLCNAPNSSVYRFDGKLIHFLAESHFSPHAIETTRRLFPAPPSRDNATARAVAESAVVHIPDVLDDPAYRSQEWAKAIGLRSVLSAPMMREGRPIGVITVDRAEAGPFPPSQVELLKSFAAQAVIAIENARLITETREALEQQTATAEVLGVINNSPGNLAPVFDAMLEKATRLCEAAFGLMSTYDGEQYHTVATHDVGPELAEFMRAPVHPDPESALGRMERGEDLVLFDDIADTDVYRKGDPRLRAIVDLGRARSYVMVALRKDRKLLGVIAAYRQEVRPFSDKQIALLQNFAAQAVIAMENARLLTETREALEQQTATAEVLQVINSSPGDLTPVFDAILEKAHSFCGATYGSLHIADGESFRAVAVRGLPEAFADLIRRPFQPGPNHPVRQLIGGASFATVINSPEYDDPIIQSAHKLSGMRTALYVPLRKENALLGYIVASRPEVRPFSDKQIALLQNFAAQAVIAMENARLITETREALEQQTATAEVLQVINSSPGDLSPVFDAMLEKAMRLCEAAFGGLTSYDGVRFQSLATRGLTPDLSEVFREPFLPAPGSFHFRLAHGEPILHGDHLENPSLQSGQLQTRGAVELGGARTGLVVALRKDDRLIGSFWFFRQEVRPFPDKQIALLQNFAAQAVIAMENARLLTETREALEQQTATAEVLQVINSSPGDLAPVFDAMLEKALRLCDAAFGALHTFDGESVHTVALRNVPSAFAEFLTRAPLRLDPEQSLLGKCIYERRTVHVPDRAADESYQRGAQLAIAAVELGDIRALLHVPLIKDNTALGAFTIYRQEVRPFSERRIALVESFAAQAVIAIENARLLTETREALEQQTATAEVLQVINSSPGDLAPVFDAMLEKALRLCNAAFGNLWTYDGEVSRPAAICGASPEYRAELVRMGPQKPEHGGALKRLVEGELLVHIADITAEGAHRSGVAVRRMLADRAGARTVLWVPLRKDGALLGFFTIYRTEVRPFTDKQIALLQNFAAQAVIAMENARLLGEVRERTRDLEESLEYQTATSDVLQVISRSTFDLQPVLDTLVETAARLCEADGGIITSREGEAYRLEAHVADLPELVALPRGHLFSIDDGSVTGRTALEGRIVHIHDLAADPEYTITTKLRTVLRTVLGVPLMREGVVVGTISLSRTRIQPFTDRQIELVRTFADQAVIAIENTRLITETREALEQQTATAEVLRVINASPGNLQPVFDAVLENATRLCAAQIAVLWMYDGDHMDAAAILGAPPEYEQFLRQGARPLSPTHERLRAGEEVIQIVNVPEYKGYRLEWSMARALFDLGGVRTILLVPLRSEDDILGAFAVYRQETQAFSDKQIALLQNFAAQAVIAIDNARLLNEIRQRQAELRVTFDNMGDGVAMFDSDQRLAAWNLNFQRILELPDPLLAERPRVGDFVRYLATHGEYGAVDVEAEVRRLSEQVGTQWSAERTRPDGRVIEVRSNPVPGGGVVLIYSDVTERKRAEAEIHAARDTAERALQELQTAQASLLHAQKMAALGQLTAGIAHEIKNPLNFVNNFAELSGELLLELKETTAPAVAALGDDERAAVDEVVEMLRGNLDKIAEHGKRADGIVKSMLEHSRGVSGERRVVDLNALIEEALNLAYHGARAQDASFNITLEREFDRGLAPTELAPQEMTRVFLNLFGNGFYATAKRQRDGAAPDFRPTLKVMTRDLGDAVEVRVRDNGTGIPPEIRDKLFQPFVTTKPTGEGTGLGLSISHDIITQQHGGTIEVDSRVGEFTEFTIRLPRPQRPVLTVAEL